MAQRLPTERTETAFEDYKPALTRDQAIAEANRCLFCSDAPCIKACPTSIDIPQFIRKIATDNVKASAKTIFEANILGSSCARVCPVEVLCVGDCVYNHLEQPPIQIGKLQRYATDLAVEHDWQYFKAGPDTGKHVALVGAGPASLAAAHQLRRFGHRVTLFEQREVVGGLNTTGVAPHKMRAEHSLREVDWVLAIGGITIKTGVTVGRDLSLEQLEKEHDAVFVGAGLGPDTALKVPGESLPGVHGAVAWIEAIKLSKVSVPSGGCVVVGGGNTAMDAVREAKTLGLRDVTLLYRGTQEQMSGYAHEWEAAKIDGVAAQWHAVAIAFEGEGKLERVRCLRLDAARKPIPGSEFTLPAQLALIAIGQSKLTALLTGLPGIRAEAGQIVADADGFTGRKGWYVGGDLRNGGKEVVNAAAEGKAAARAIHATLMGAPRG